MPVKGVQQVRRRYRIAVKEIAERRTEGAVYAILSQGGALAAQMTPIDTSTLVNSQFAPRIEVSGPKVKGAIGFTAHYAAAVHEAPGKLKGEPRTHFGKTREGVEFGGGTGVGNYWDPNAEPEFLKKGFEQLRPEIPAMLKRLYGA